MENENKEGDIGKRDSLMLLISQSMKQFDTHFINFNNIDTKTQWYFALISGSLGYILTIE
jgi:hypothetical protein